MGNCTWAPEIPSAPQGKPDGLNGNSTDGTCGGSNYLTCNFALGSCCNKDGICGTQAADCGTGW